VLTMHFIEPSLCPAHVQSGGVFKFLGFAETEARRAFHAPRLLNYQLHANL